MLPDGNLEGVDAALAGKVGLWNSGNSCFVNAGLQCLSHVEPLRKYFLHGEHKSASDRTSTPEHGGEVAEAFAELQHQLWRGGRPKHDPQAFCAKLTPLAPHLFESREQQDVQEFLAFCLDALHADLNRAAAAGGAREEEALADGPGVEEEYAAALAWKRYLERGKSFLVDLLQGQVRSSVTCCRCGHRSRRFEPFLYLSVPVSEGTNSIAEAIEEYSQAELLSAGDQWFCPVCGEKVDAQKKMDLWKLPPVLVLHLKRFEFDRRTCSFRKIDRLVSAPPQLDLSPHCGSTQRDGALYATVCIANHLGPFGHGHYTATCRVGGPDGRWYHFNDERVQPLPAGKAAVGSDAYVIFLERCSAAVGSGKCKRQSVSMPEHWPHRQSVVARLPMGASTLAARGHAPAPAVHDQTPSTVPVLGARLMEGWLCWFAQDGKWTWIWCVLYPGALLFYVDDACEEEEDSFHICQSTCVASLQEDPLTPVDAPFGFSVYGESSAVTGADRCCLAANTKESLVAWMQAIEHVATGDISSVRSSDYGACCVLA